MTRGGFRGDDDNSKVSISHKQWNYSTYKSNPVCLRLNVGVRTGTPETPPPQSLKVSYTAVISAGQDPKTVFLGWTTPSFRYMEDQPPGQVVELLGELSTPGQVVELLGELSTPGVVCNSTAYLMCLADVLDRQQLPLQSSQRYGFGG